MEYKIIYQYSFFIYRTAQIDLRSYTVLVKIFRFFKIALYFTIYMTP